MALGVGLFSLGAFIIGLGWACRRPIGFGSKTLEIGFAAAKRLSSRAPRGGEFFVWSFLKGAWAGLEDGLWALTQGRLRMTFRLIKGGKERFADGLGFYSCAPRRRMSAN